MRPLEPKMVTPGAGIDLCGRAIGQPVPRDGWWSTWVWAGNTSDDFFTCEEVEWVNCCILRPHHQPCTTWATQQYCAVFKGMGLEVELPKCWEQFFFTAQKQTTVICTEYKPMKDVAYSAPAHLLATSDKRKKAEEKGREGRNNRGVKL